MNGAECLLIIGMIKQLSHEIDQNAFINRETGDKVVKSDIIESCISNLLETLDEVYEDIKV